MINTREVAQEYRLSHWAQIIRERTQAGQSIKDLCLEKGICQNTYFYWQRRVRASACEQLALRPPEAMAAHNFAEVKVIEPPALPPVIPASQLCVEIGGCKITADSTYPTEMLASLLLALSKPC